MNVVVALSNGQRVEGMLLAAGRYALRVLFPGDADVTELLYQYGQWTGPASQVVELDAFFTESGFDHAFFNQEVLGEAQSLGAGSDTN